MARPVVILGCGDLALMGLLLSLTLPCLGNTKVTLTALLQTRSPLGEAAGEGCMGWALEQSPTDMACSVIIYHGGRRCLWLVNGAFYSV